MCLSTDISVPKASAFSLSLSTDISAQETADFSVPLTAVRGGNACTVRSRIEVVLRSGHVLFVADSMDTNALAGLIDILERDGEC